MKSNVYTIFFMAFITLSTSAQTVGFWEFDSTGSILNDSSGNFLNGKMGFLVSTETDPVPSSDTPSGAAGDRALDIIGGPVVADDSANKKLDLFGQEFTAEFWIKVKEDMQGLSWRGTVYYGRHGTGWGIGTRDKDLKFTLFGVVDIFPGITLEADEQWHHLAFVYEPNVGVTFYVDGEEFTFEPETRAMNQTNTNILWLGTEDGASRPIPALIDRFRVTQGLLTQDQLDSDAANPKPVTAETLVYFPFDEESGPEFSDTAGGLTALVGTEWFSTIQAPDYVEDTPTNEGLALSFVQGDHAVVEDPDEEMNYQDESFTLEAWVKPETFPGDVAVIIRYGGAEAAPTDSGGYGVTLNQSTGTIGLTFYQIQGAGSNFTVSTPENTFPFDDQWHHIAVVYSEEDLTVQFYLDGEPVHEEVYVLGIITAKDVFVLHLGGQWDGREPYVGLMDRVRVSSAALTADQLDFQEIVSVQDWSLF